MMIGPAPMIRMLWMSVLLGIAQTEGKQARSNGAVSGAFISCARAVSATGARRVRFGQPQLRLQASQHQMIEALEQRFQVVWPRTGFRVSLEAEHRLVLERESLQRAVEQRAVRRSHISRQGRLVHGEAMILAGDEHTAGIQVLHRVIGAVMAEFHFHRLRADGESENLVAEADAEYRQVGLQELAGGG